MPSRPSSRIARKLSTLFTRDIPAILALAAALACATPACTSRSCTAMYVPNQATVARKVAATFDPAKPIRVELCKNDVCQSGEIVVAAPAGAPPPFCRTDGDVSFTTGCTFVREADGTYAFAARWIGEGTPFEDGDRYRAALTSPDGPLLAVDAVATYTTSEPNGEGCGITKSASL